MRAYLAGAYNPCTAHTLPYRTLSVYPTAPTLCTLPHTFCVPYRTHSLYPTAHTLCIRDSSSVPANTPSCCLLPLPLLLLLLLLLLPPLKMEGAHQAAMRSYVQQHPGVFGACFTPDCPQVCVCVGGGGHGLLLPV